MLLDFFTYTRATEGGAFSVEQLIEAAKCAHLDGICITDKNSSSHAGEYLKAADIDDFFVGVGVEITTREGSLVCFPAEIDEDFIGEKWKAALGAEPESQKVIDYFKKNGGAVVARNVYGAEHGLRDRLFLLHGLDAIDTVSALRRRIDNELAMEAQQVLSLPGVGGSGTLDNIREIGHVATLSCVDIYEQRELVAAIRAQNLWAVSTRSIGEATPEGTALASSDAEPAHGHSSHDREARCGEGRHSHEGRREGGNRGERRPRGRERSNGGDRKERRSSGRRRSPKND